MEEGGGQVVDGEGRPDAGGGEGLGRVGNMVGVGASLLLMAIFDLGAILYASEGNGLTFTAKLSW